MRWMSLALVAMAACSGDPSDPTQPKAPTTERAQSSGAPSAQPSSEARGEPPAEVPDVTDAVPVPDAVAEAWYGDRFLVILGSYASPGQTPDGFEKLASSGLDAKPARLTSGRYKGLMPCWEIVVANGFKTRKQATQWAAPLKDIGLDYYVKNAGAYVGASKQVDRYCADVQEADSGDGGTCADELRFVVDVGGVPHVALALDPLVEERLMADVYPPTPVDESGTVWFAPLGAERVGDIEVGSVYTLVDLVNAEMVKDCKVDRFAALTRGIPHFSWADMGGDEPGCGTARPFAVLDCTLAGLPALAVPPGRTPPEVFEKGGALTGEALEAYRSAAREDRSFQVHLGLAQADATAVDAELVVDIQVATYSGTSGLRVVRAEMVTGEGFDLCGGDDVRREVVGVFAVGDKDDAVGKLLVPFQDTTWATVDGVVRLSDGSWRLAIQYGFGGQSLLNGAGEETCALEEPFCDCAC